MIDIEQRRKVQDLIQEGKYDSAEKVLNRMINEEPEEASLGYQERSHLFRRGI